MSSQVVAFIGDLQESLESCAAEVAREISEQIAFYRDSNAVPFKDLRDSCLENLTFLMRGMVGEELSTEAAEAMGRRRAEAGVPLPAVLAAYRVGFRVMWEQVVAEARRRDIAAEVVIEATAGAMATQEVFIEAMTAAHNATTTAQLLSDEAERSAVVEAVLSGAIVGRHTLWEAADLLRLPTSGRFVVVAAVLTTPARFVLPAADSTLRSQGYQCAWRLLPDAQVGILEIGDRSVEDVVELFAAHERLRAGVSPVFHELTEAARGLECARLAAAVAPDGGGVLQFDDNPVGIAAAAAGEPMRRMAIAVLEPLDALGEAERQTLLNTLRVWIDVGGSATRAASELFCHANTVRYRLRRLEEKTERRLDRPTDVAALCLALEALAIAERRSP